MNRSHAARELLKFCSRSTATKRKTRERSQVRANRPDLARESKVRRSQSCSARWRCARQSARPRSFAEKARQGCSHLERRRHAREIQFSSEREFAQQTADRGGRCRCCC